MDGSAQRKIRVRSAGQLIAAVPVMLGFHPDPGSLVVAGVNPADSTVLLVMRYDIPQVDNPHLFALQVAAILASNGIQTALAVGYGPDALVRPFAEALIQSRTGVAFREVLRAEDGRYWSYTCTGSCHPAEGTPYALYASAHAVGVLASRAELAASVALDGDRQPSMSSALALAYELVLELTGPGGDDRASRRSLWGAATAAIEDAVRDYRVSDSYVISLNRAAWLTLLLHADLRNRDYAWALMEPEHAAAHLRLWRDLTRLNSGPRVAPVASLLAFVAWQTGNGALANVALDRALTGDPDYSMAQLLRDVLYSGMPPSAAKLPMTPQEVDASYEELDR